MFIWGAQKSYPVGKIMLSFTFVLWNICDFGLRTAIFAVAREATWMCLYCKSKKKLLLQNGKSNTKTGNSNTKISNSITSSDDIRFLLLQWIFEACIWNTTFRNWFTKSCNSITILCNSKLNYRHMTLAFIQFLIHLFPLQST